MCHNDVMARSAHLHPYLEVTRTRNQTTIWGGLNVDNSKFYISKCTLH